MAKLLDKLGTELPLGIEEIPSTSMDLDIDNPQCDELRLLDFFLLTLAKPINSVYLVHDSLDLLNEYVNALALLMSDTYRFAEVIKLSSSRIFALRPRFSSGEYISKLIAKHLDGKKLHTLDMEELLKIVKQDKETWDKNFNKIAQEASSNDYILVIYKLGELFRRDKRRELHYQALDFFYSTRAKAKFTFIAPMEWIEYVDQIERGVFPLLIKHRTPILFSPRPNNLPKPTVSELVPDNSFVFSNR